MDDARDKPLGVGSLLAAAGGLLLLASLFVDWYGPEDTGFGESDGGISAWNSFELLDLLLAALAVAAVYGALSRLARNDRAPAPPSGLVRAAGPVALVLVLYSIADKPPILNFSESDFALGIWLALAGALLMTAGAILDRYRVSLVLGERERGPARASAPPVDPAAETQSMRQTPPPPGR